MRNNVLMTSLAALMSASVAFSAAAECSHTSAAKDKVPQQTVDKDVKSDPTEIIQEMVENAEPTEGPDSPAYIETGPAEPRENWFGCGPESKSEHCDTKDAAEIAQSNPAGKPTTAVEQQNDAEQDTTDDNVQKPSDPAEQVAAQGGCGGSEQG